MLAGFQVRKNSPFRDDIRLQLQYFAKHFPWMHKTDLNLQQKNDL